MFKIPPHIGWPLFVISLLLASFGTGAAIVYFAYSDGGAQIVVQEDLPQQTPPSSQR
ncbi:MAG: hypothetical protein ACI80V_003782 [Rhodothermales bacterium]|jgi:hypothetical protein